MYIKIGFSGYSLDDGGYYLTINIRQPSIIYKMDRRTFLRATTGVGVVGFAGCLGRSDDDDGDDDDAPEPLEAAFEWNTTEPRLDQAITFDASEATGDISTYRWEFGGSNRATVEDGQPQTTHTFEDIGEKSVELVVEDSNAETETAVQTIVIKSPESLEGAIDTLVENAQHLDYMALPTDEDGSVPRGVERERIERDRDEIETICTRLTEVTSALDETEATVGDVLEERIEAARDCVKLQEQLCTENEHSLNAAESFRSGAKAYQQLQDSPTREKAADAATEFTTVSEALENQRAARRDFESAQEAYEPTVLDESALEYTEQVVQYVRFRQDTIDEIEQLSRLFVNIAAMIEKVFTGRDAFESEQWEKAENEFISAEKSIGEARYLFERIQFDSSGVEFFLREAKKKSFVEEQQLLFETASEEISDLIDMHENAAATAIQDNTGAAKELFDDATEEWEEAMFEGGEKTQANNNSQGFVQI